MDPLVKANWHKTRPEAYGFLEFFCGYGWVSTVMRSQDVPTASFDVDLGVTREGKQNNMDLLTPAGFGLLICKMMTHGGYMIVLSHV